LLAMDKAIRVPTVARIAAPMSDRQTAKPRVNEPLVDAGNTDPLTVVERLPKHAIHPIAIARR